MIAGLIIGLLIGFTLGVMFVIYNEDIRRK